MGTSRNPARLVLRGLCLVILVAGWLFVVAGQMNMAGRLLTPDAGFWDIVLGFGLPIGACLWGSFLIWVTRRWPLALVLPLHLLLMFLSLLFPWGW